MVLELLIVGRNFQKKSGGEPPDPPSMENMVFFSLAVPQLGFRNQSTNFSGATHETYVKLSK